ncbi:putative calcium-binding protein CML35 [Drosera capensis]
MKISIDSLNPKKLFSTLKTPKSNSKSSSLTRSDARSLSASSTDSAKTPRTPTSVLPSQDYDDLYNDLLETFRIIDRDNDGKITSAELSQLFRWITPKDSSVPTDEEIHSMMNEIDADGDGAISFEEFRAIGSAFGPAIDGRELRETFDVFDEDHDGRISAEELHKVFVAIGDERCTIEDCRDMIATVDVNGDGFVCFEDFKLMMEHQTC